MPRLFSAIVLTALASLAPAVAGQQQPSPSSPDVPKIKLQRIAQLDKPIEVRADPSGRLFFVEQPGRASIVEDGKVVEPPYLDLSNKVYVAYECGLLGLTFHPKFEQNGLLYASYTTNVGPGGGKQAKVRSFVSEFRADPKARTVDLATERVLFSLDQPYDNHNGGQVQFGPDGMLYFGFGDGGSGHDPHNNAQNPDTWLGKILRIDPTPGKPDASGKAAPYTVPADNPFVGRPGWRPEIWTLGMRNPWRFSFDRQTGLLYAADVGQDVWEEVDIITKGGNYGWRIMEGKDVLHPGTPTTTPLIDPIFQYNHNKTAASITGGYVYRGKKIPALQGWYLFGDYSFGTIFGLKYEGGKVVASGAIVDPKLTGRSAGQRPTQPSAFGEDKDGELYMADVNGWVYKIVAPE